MFNQTCWPYENEPCSGARTLQSLRIDAKLANSEESLLAFTSLLWLPRRSVIGIHLEINGVKGASPLLLAKPFDVSKGVAMDCMHGMFLGLPKKLLDVWLQPAYRHRAVAPSPAGQAMAGPVFEKMTCASGTMQSTSVLEV